MIQWNELRSVLEGLYRVSWPEDFGGFIPFDMQKDMGTPSWYEIEESVSFGGITIDGPGAILYDPDIGILLFLFPYLEGDKEKVVSLVQKTLRLRSRLYAGPIQEVNETYHKRIGRRYEFAFIGYRQVIRLISPGSKL